MEESEWNNKSEPKLIITNSYTNENGKWPLSSTSTTNVQKINMITWLNLKFTAFDQKKIDAMTTNHLNFNNRFPL
jgi:hypothetical protein